MPNVQAKHEARNQPHARQNKKKEATHMLTGRSHVRGLLVARRQNKRHKQTKIKNKTLIRQEAATQPLPVQGRRHAIVSLMGDVSWGMVS